MRVPFFKPSIGEQELEAVASCMRSGWLTTGQITRAFEDEIARFLGAKHAVALNSCTAALHLALAAAGIQRGDLVLVPTWTFAATAEVVVHLGATPVLVDSDARGLHLDVAHAARLCDTLTSGRAAPGVVFPAPPRAILPVHFAGEMCDVDGNSSADPRPSATFFCATRRSGGLPGAADFMLESALINADRSRK